MYSHYYVIFMSVFSFFSTNTYLNFYVYTFLNICFNTLFVVFPLFYIPLNTVKVLTSINFSVSIIELGLVVI